MKNKPNSEAAEPSGRVDKYLVPIVAKMIDLLNYFSSTNQALTLEDVVKRTGIPHTTTFRILHTLVASDYLSRDGRSYQLGRSRKRLTIGFANLSKHVCLATEIQTSVEKAMVAAGITLLVWDNDKNPDVAVRNAEEIAKQKVDLAIEFQLSEQVAPVISDILSRAGIPLISLVNPHHGTIYLGVNNYRAGVSAGIALADHAIRRWKSKVDAILLLESPLAGRATLSRNVGVIRGIEEQLGTLPKSIIHHRDGGGEKAMSKAATATFLKESRPGRRVLVMGINDESAIGATQAVMSSKESAEVAIVGHGGSDEILELIAKPKSPCIGTVSFCTERYGPHLLSLVLAIVQGKPVPTIHYVPHKFLGKDKVR